MALQFGHFSPASLMGIGAANMIMLIGMTLNTKRGVSPIQTDPKQILFGVLSACMIMLVILLMCVFVAYIAMAALQAF